MFGVGLLSPEAIEYVRLCESPSDKQALIAADRWRRRRAFIMFRVCLLAMISRNDEGLNRDERKREHELKEVGLFAVRQWDGHGERSATDMPYRGLLTVIGEQALAFKIATFL